MKKDSKYIWYLIDIVVFLTLNYILLRRFNVSVLLFLEQMNWMVLFILALGIYRLTDIVTQESVTDVIRASFMDKEVVNGKETWQPAELGFRGFWATLLSCNACMGVWMSAIVFYSFLFWPTPTLIFMVIMTLTGFERFFSKIYNFLEKRG